MATSIYFSMYNGGSRKGGLFKMDEKKEDIEFLLKFLGVDMSEKKNVNNFSIFEFPLPKCSAGP